MARRKNPCDDAPNERDLAEQWLRERTQPGNWLDIAPKEEIPPGIKNWDLTLVHMQQLFFAPELRRRKEAGLLPESFLFWAGQLLQPHEGERVVRINEEVKCVSYVRTGRPVEKGEQVRLQDLAKIEYLDLIDEELDCGHFTVFYTGSAWVGAFDLRSGRAKCLALIDKATTFLEAAKLSHAKGLVEPTIDLLESACEQIARSKLILSHIPERRLGTHRSVNSAINLERKLGNVEPAFVELFNKLWNLRNPARYSAGFKGTLPSQEEIALVEAMATGLSAAIRQRRPKDFSSDPDE